MQFMEKKDPFNIPNTDFYEQLHDAILRTEDGSTYKIHRCLLAKRSTYFLDLFTGGGNNKKDILIEEISGQTLQQILYYLYEGALELNEQNLQDIMIAADYMLLDDLVQQCREFAIRCMTTSNCLLLLVIAARHERLNIFRECSRYAKVHFEGIVKNFPEKIADLPFEVLMELLKDSSLNVTSEVTVETVIDIWVRTDPVKRNQHVPDLLKCIRLEEDKPPMTKKSKNATGISNPICIKSNSFFAAHSPDSPPASSKPVLRFPKYLHVIVKCLRRTCKSEGSTEMYLTCDEELDFWRKIGEIAPVIPDFIVPIRTHVYLFLVEQNIILRYDLLDNSFITLSGIVNRDCYCIAKLHNKIYALGGASRTDLGEDQNLDTVEYYDPDSETWNRVKSVGAVLIDHAVAMCGRIYALGHTGSLNDQEKKGIPRAMMWMRVYNPITDTWSTVKSPRVLDLRRGFGAAVFENRLFLFGAEYNNKRLKVRSLLRKINICVEEYDPVPDVWTRLPDLPVKYHRPRTEVVAGKLIVFDKPYHKSTCPDSPIVCWDGVTRSWQITNKSFVFYNTVNQYIFGILDDPVVVRDVVTRSRQCSAVKWNRISSS